MNVVLLGGTRGMGRALGRAYAARGDTLFLLGRDAVDLAKSGADFVARGGKGNGGHAYCDLEKPSTFEPAIAAAEAALGRIDAVIVTAALFATQEELEADAELAERVLRANFTNTVLFCEAVRKRLLAGGGGTLCVFSSVAGERGRKPVVIYGASKAGLSSYLEGLDHKFRAQGLRVVTVKPGFVKTEMTEGLKPPPFAGEPDDVARAVVRAIDHGTPVVYTPLPWALVMGVIRNLPRAVMRRVKF